MEKFSSTKAVLGAKKVGDRWYTMGQKIVQPTNMINKDVYYVFLGGGKKATKQYALYEHSFVI